MVVDTHTPFAVALASAVNVGADVCECRCGELLLGDRYWERRQRVLLRAGRVRRRAEQRVRRQVSGWTRPDWEYC